MTDTDSR